MMKTSYRYRSFLIVAGILFFYVMQMAPSPVLHLIREDFSLEGKEALLNMAVSVIFPTIVLGALTGAGIEKRYGLKALYTLSIVLTAAGSLLGMVCGKSYILFLTGRAIFGLGFGYGIPFIGSAIMQWFRPQHRELMDTVNSMFPFFGTTICFLLVQPLSDVFSGNWRLGLGVWGLPLILILLLWLGVEPPSGPAAAAQEESGMFRDIMSRKEILLICVTFVCDFCCYSYIGVILPSLLLESSLLSEWVVNLCAAVAFPVMGVIGAAAGGVWCKRSGLRKPSLVLGQLLKFIGIAVMVLLGPQSIWLTILGTALFGFANGLWMPAMYCLPMELEGMSPEKVGAAFGIISAFGLAFGFIAPTIGGWLTTGFMAMRGGDHVFGLRWSLMIFGVLNLVGFVCTLLICETGTRKN